MIEAGYQAGFGAQAICGEVNEGRVLAA